MTERTPPLNLQNATTHTAAGDRALLFSLYNGKEGLTTTTDLAVTQNGSPNMSVNVAAGRALVLGDDNSDQQLYHVWNDAVVNKTIAAADPTNPRRDLVVAEVRDTLYGGAANDWRLRVVTGTPAASPADPATPNNALVLARVAVAAAASSITNANITALATVTKPWHTAWGEVAQTVQTSNGTTLTTSLGDAGLSVTWTAIPGRRYRIEMDAVLFGGTGTGIVSMYITDASGNSKARGIFHTTTPNQYGSLMMVAEESGLSGSTTRKIMGVLPSGTGGVLTSTGASNPNYLSVYDIGPA